MGTNYFLYRKDNNTAFDLGRGSFAFNFGFGVTNFNSQLEVVDSNSLLTWVTVTFPYKESYYNLLLIRDRLLDFLEEAAKRNVIFINLENLGELLQSNVWKIVTHDIYHIKEDLAPYQKLCLYNLKEYIDNPLKFYKENNISKQES